MKERAYMDVIGAIETCADYIVDFTSRVQNVTAIFLDGIGPFASVVAFSMIISILFHAARLATGSMLRKAGLYILYGLLLFGLLVPTIEAVLDAYGSSGDTSMSSDLSVAVMVLVLMLATVAVTALMIIKRSHGSAIQVGLLIGALLLQWAMTAWVMTIAAWIIASLVAIVFVLVVK